MTSVDRRPALFVSSTALDLQPFREVVIHVCQRLGIDLLAMEEFGPDPRTATALCQEKIERADLFLGLYAHRYGHTPEGFGGVSITELEYEWAAARRPPLPVLLFLVDEEQPWPPRWIDRGEQWDRLQALKARLRKRHVVSALTTPERLRDDLFVHLPRFRDQAQPRAVAPVGTVPSPPEPYVAHLYTLLQTAQVVGRNKELTVLDGWVSDPTSRFAAARALCVVAVGGMGKSALAWKWFHERAPQAMAPLAGQMWWSFYETDAGFDRFVTMALAYCSGQPPESLQALSPVDRERELLSRLDPQPYLLVLDGLERVLIAYSNLDFAHLSEEDLDSRTANVVAGALGLPQGAGGTFLGRHRLRKTIDPRVGNFLRALARTRAARILVTTRLFPSDLQADTGNELPGTAAWFLRGLEQEDALAMWRAMGVSGSDTDLSQLFTSIEHYPLLIRALAGEVAGYRPAPGDFERWRRAHTDFNPFALPLVQAKTHVLAHALGNLDDDASELLHTIAAFRSPIGYDTLGSLFVHGRDWAPRKLDTVLSELEDRGLLGWDRGANRYDLHPIVRGVVWSGLDDIRRRAVYGTLEQHFSAIPATSEGANTVEEALPLIELFNALVGLGRFEDAGKLYFDRLHVGNFSFADAGMNHVNIALLESLFPQGLDQPPAVGPDHAGHVVAQLGHAYDTSGRLTEAYAWAIRALALSSENTRAITHSYVSRRALALGHVREALDHARIAVREKSSLTEFHIGDLALCEARIGNIKPALDRLAAQQVGKYYDPRQREARIRLWEGDYDRATTLEEAAIARGVRQGYLRKSMTVLLAEARMNLGYVEDAIAAFLEFLREARAKVLVELELESLRRLAEAYRRLGDHTQSRVCLDDLAELAARGPYRLIQADAANVLAALERDLGDPKAAVAAAEAAYRYAWCDGPPHAYHWALERAGRLLRELEAPLPQM